MKRLLLPEESSDGDTYSKPGISLFLPKLRTVQIIGTIGAALGLIFGLVLRFQASQRPGASFFHTGQSFPPREWKGTTSPNNPDGNIFVEPDSATIAPESSSGSAQPQTSPIEPESSSEFTQPQTAPIEPEFSSEFAQPQTLPDKPAAELNTEPNTQFPTRAEPFNAEPFSKEDAIVPANPPESPSKDPEPRSSESP